MAKKCLNHEDRPAATMCHQCHKPICKSCVMMTPRGAFCSTECGLFFRDMKLGLGAPKERGFTGKVVVLVIMIFIAAVFIFHFVARDVPSLRKYDIIGKFMKYPEDTRPPKK